MPNFRPQNAEKANEKRPVDAEEKSVFHKAIGVACLPVPIADTLQATLVHRWHPVTRIRARTHS